MPKSSVIVLLSGGQDSTTCLGLAKEQFDSVYALTINYGQRHSREIEAATAIAKFFGVVEHEIVSIGKGVLAGSSPLVDSTKRVESYKDSASLPGGLEKTYVPGRNALFLVVCANRASVLGVSNIMVGVSQEDFGGYPDCREQFIKAMQEALNEGFPQPFKIITPLLFLTKRETVRLGVRTLGVMDALKFSHTCYNGISPPCGECHACLLRQKGFVEAGALDPLGHID